MLKNSTFITIGGKRAITIHNLFCLCYILRAFLCIGLWLNHKSFSFRNNVLRRPKQLRGDDWLRFASCLHHLHSFSGVEFCEDNVLSCEWGGLCLLLQLVEPM